MAHELRKGSYYDSVVLMQLQRALLELPGVTDAGVVMATGANLELVQQNSLLPEGLQAAPEDLLIVVQGEGAEEALARVDELLARRRSVPPGEFRPHSLQAALDYLPEAQWVLISVPGRYAAAVARESLEHGRHVFLYSDNVSLEDEIELKRFAAERELLMMGPDCGTAIVNGIGFGFANRVRRGAIGLVGASGTGLQAITSRIHQLGAGVSHALGTGGRDLKRQVAGRTAQHSLAALAADPETAVVVLVSKPPDPQVSAALLQQAWQTGKPVVVSFIGYPPPARQIGRLTFASSLNEAAELAVHLLERVGVDESVGVQTAGPSDAAHGSGSDSGRPASGPVDPQPGNRADGEQRASAEGRYLRGLFAGGTLASEALRGLQALLGTVYSNLAEPRLADPLVSQGHTVLDLGEDEFTVGRLHPMIDNDLRLRRLRQEAEDAEVGLLLLDVVLGEGAHPDPAAELAPAIEEVRGKREIEVGVVLVGTDQDPQGFESQWERLAQAGAHVFADTAAAVGFCASRLIAGEPTDVAADFLGQPVAAINLGLESFYDSLRDQGAQAVQVDWKPPAGGNERLQAILQKMQGD